MSDRGGSRSGAGRGATDRDGRRGRAAAPRVGLVLGAGGVAGHSFHAGVLRALAESTGWDARHARLIVGTSAGSIVGTALRAGLSPADLYARVVDETLSPEGERLLVGVPPPGSGSFERDGRRFLPTPASPGLLGRLVARPWRARPGLVLAGLLPEGRVDAGGLARDVDALLGNAGHPRSRPDGIWVVATRLDDGRRIVFGRGDEAVPGPWSWGEAVAASCAIPGFFAPVRVGGARVVDGGAHSPTNADLVGPPDDLDLVVVSSPMSSPRSARHRSLDAPVRAAYRWRLGGELAALRRRGVPVATFQATRAVLEAAGLNAMSPAIRVPVARAAYEAALGRLGSLGPDHPLRALSAVARSA